MGTRSATGFRLNGRDVLAYNQLDGYPEGIGQEIVKEIIEGIASLGYEPALATWRKLAGDIKIVDKEQKPTKADIAATKAHTNLEVSKQSTNDWYCLLRNLQGTIIARLKSGYILDASDFITQSLFCEWAYILNLDDEVFEVYQGFQKQPHDKGRYADVREGLETIPARRYVGLDGTVEEVPELTYYPCALIASIPLDELPQLPSLREYLEAIGALEKEPA
jgi:hypothetical protein